MANTYEIKRDLTNLKLINRFWGHIKRKRRFQIKVLILLMLLSGFFEIISIGSLLPFLSALTNSEKLLENNIGYKFYTIIGISNNNQLVLILTIFFGLAVIASNSTRLLNIWATGRLTALVGSDLSCKAYKNTLYQQYSYHVKKNSSDLIASLSIQINTTISILYYNLLK